jgi:hypothetical protein
MVKKIALLLLVSVSAYGAQFDERMYAGKAALSSPDGQKYEASWGQVMGTVIHACVPPGSISPTNLGKFTFVANVASSGLVSDVEVRPVTKVSRCFAQKFSGSRLPPPPLADKKDSSFPIADEMVIAP